MRFENDAQLANHVKKFCKNSNYADPTKLEDRSKALKSGRNSQSMSNLNFNDVKDGIKRGTLGGQSLENLKGKFVQSWIIRHQMALFPT